MANKYFLALGGNFTDTTKWAASAVDAAANTNSSSTPTSADAAILTVASGQCTISATSVAGSLDGSAYLNTLTHNAFTLTVSGNITFGVGMTYTPLATATLRTNANSTINIQAGHLLPNLTTLTTGTLTLGTDLNFMASKTLAISVGASTGLDLAGFKMLGNSAINRPIFSSGTLGTSRSITNATSTSFNNVDFRDIQTYPAAGVTGQAIENMSDSGGGTSEMETTGAHGLSAGQRIWLNAPYNASVVVNSSADANHVILAVTYTSTASTWNYDLTNNGASSIGDCGGNTGAHHTTARTATATGNSANWSSTTADAPWSSGLPPLPQDSVNFNMTAAQTLTVDMPRIGGGGANGIYYTTATKLSIAIACTSYGSVNYTGRGTITNGGFLIWNMESMARNGTVYLTMGSGNTWGSADTSFNMAGTAVLEFADSFSSVGRISMGTTNRLYMGAVTVTTTRANTQGFNAAGIIDAGTSTLHFSDTGTNVKQLNGSGYTFYNVTTASSSGGLALTGSNSFNSIQAASGGKITLTANTTQTLTGDMSSGFGNGTNVLTITSTTTTPAILKLTGTPSYVNADYLALTYNTGQNAAGATATNTWFYGSNSTAGAGVTGWNSGAFSAGGGRLLLLGVG